MTRSCPTIAAFSRGISGGVLELARAAQDGDIKTVLFTDRGSEKRMRDFGLFGEIITAPLGEMYAPENLIRLFLERSKKGLLKYRRNQNGF